MSDETVRVLLVVVVSYLLGSIPTAYIVGRIKHINIFETGSGNMGGTNVIRAVGTGWGIGVLVFDTLKGIIAILISRLILSENTAAATTIAAIVVIIGHNWSLFATMITGSLRGGKGAATAFGTLLMMAPIPVILGVSLVGGAVIAVTRYVSLGVLFMVGVATTWMFVLVSQQQIPGEYMYYILIVTAMILYRFRQNIQRLLAGTERRLGERA
ncbi:MAG: glycerol-3-phosphate acyltransferase [Burkholderiales bacterium]|nr:glycerol-3-phosphate acyltransferase [Anaerolineae bacterium]